MRNDLAIEIRGFRTPTAIYIEIAVKDLKKLGILDKISSHSIRHGDHIYIERCKIIPYACGDCIDTIPEHPKDSSLLWDALPIGESYTAKQRRRLPLFSKYIDQIFLHPKHTPKETLEQYAFLLEGCKQYAFLSWA